MKYISKYQGGVSMLGIFIIMMMLGCFLMFGLALFPLYNEYLGVKTSMKSVINQPPEKRKTIKNIRKLFIKSAGLNNVYFFTDKNIDEIVTLKKSEDGKQYFLNVKYQDSKKLFKNVHVMMDVNESLEIPGD